MRKFSAQTNRTAVIPYPADIAEARKRARLMDDAALGGANKFHQVAHPLGMTQLGLQPL